MAPRRGTRPAARTGSAHSRSARSASRRKRRRSHSPNRLIALFVAFSISFLAIGARLVTLQIIEAPEYEQLALDQREREIIFPGRRGAILDRAGEPLAISVDLQTVFTDPAHVENAAAEAARLAPLLGLEPGQIEKKLAGSWPGDRFEYLKRQVEPKTARKVKELDLPGVYLTAEPKRFYPGGRLASHVLGFVDVDGNGLEGVEMQYDDILQGRPGRMVLEQDPAGRPLPQAEFSYKRPHPGRSLFLTIDKELQYFTELTLAEATRTYHAESGSAIVMKPGTGEILALANVPDFDPNRPGEFTTSQRRNRAVIDVYEPGSAYKIVTASAALEERVVTPKSSFVVPYSFAYSDRVFHDSHAHATERMSVTDIIVESSNVGTIQIGLRLGRKRLDEYVRRFGFGSQTGLDFPGESPGIVLDPKNWSGSTIATIPIGQGIAVTPLQLLNAYATIANKGVWIEPKLLHSTMGSNGKIVPSSSPARRRVISRRTAREMRRIFIGVTDHGTGVEAQIPGYGVAGKTGTAQKPLPGGGYGNSYVASFGGFAPARDPAIVVLVVLDDPSPYWGGYTAAPTFKLIAEFALRHLGVSPTTNAEKAARQIEADRAGDPVGRD